MAADDYQNDEPSPLAQLGRSGLPFYAGYVQAETLTALSGHRWRKVCKEMQTDAVVGAMLYALEHLIRQVDFSFVPADDSPQALELKDFYHHALFSDMQRTWRDTLSEIATFLGWGFAPLELVYKQRRGLTPGTTPGTNGKPQPLPRSKFNDGKYGWHYWPLRGQDTVEKWDFTDYGEVEAMWQLSPPDWQWIRIPSQKMLLFRTTVKSNNPEGKSIIRNAWNSWFYRTNYQRFEGIGVERDLAGVPLFRLPAAIINAQVGTSDYQVLQNYIRVGTNIRRDEQVCIIMPSDCDEGGNRLYDFELTGTGSTRNVDMESKIQRLDQRILMTTMMDFLLLGHQKVGSFALADSKTELFITALGSLLDAICEVITRDAVPRLAELNQFNLELLPTLHHGDVETQDLGILGDYLSKLTEMGALAFPTASGEIESHLVRQAGLPVSEDPKDMRVERPEPDAEPPAKPNAGRVPDNKTTDKDEEERTPKDNGKDNGKPGGKPVARK